MSEAKDNARKKILQHCINNMNSNRKIKALTLPSINFKFENYLSREFKNVDIDCFEREPLIYRKAKEILTDINYPYNLVKGNILSHLKDTCKVYDLIWLDLCGPINLELIQELINLVKSRRLDDKSILSITLQKGREHNSVELMEAFNTDNLDYIRYKIFPELLKNAAKESGRVLELLDKKPLEYKCELSRFSSTMNLFNFKISNN